MDWAEDEGEDGDDDDDDAQDEEGDVVPFDFLDQQEYDVIKLLPASQSPEDLDLFFR